MRPKYIVMADQADGGQSIIRNPASEFSKPTKTNQNPNHFFFFFASLDIEIQANRDITNKLRI